MRRRLAAELFGTFALVFAGTGAIVVNAASGGQVTHVGVSLTFGLIVLAMVYAVGDVSGAHLNPAVTVGFAVAGRFPVREVLPYVAVQCAGALLASGTLRFLFPGHPNLGATLPAGTALQSFVLEVILTLMLMFVALSVATGAKERGLMAGVAVGGVVALEALFAGPWPRPWCRGISATCGCTSPRRRSARAWPWPCVGVSTTGAAAPPPTRSASRERADPEEASPVRVRGK
jgi:aquaporin Z